MSPIAQKLHIKARSCNLCEPLIHTFQKTEKIKTLVLDKKKNYLHSFANYPIKIYYLLSFFWLTSISKFDFM